MKWPWIARDSHEETVRLLQEQIADMKAERLVLMDRLAAMGLGGPLFHLPTVEQAAESEEEEQQIDPQEEIDRILSLSRRPSLMAKAIREKVIRDKKLGTQGPSVARIPKIDQAFEAAEAEGRKQG